MADLTKLNKTGLTLLWSKITTLFVAKEAGKGLSTNDYDAAAVAEVAKIASKADKATSLSGYGIADAYTKDEVDTAINEIKADISSIYKVKGSIPFSNLPVADMEEGDVYNITDSFTVTNAFVEYAADASEQKTYPAGTNVVYTANGWDCLAGTYDFSNFATKNELATDITEEEINAICVIS